MKRHIQARLRKLQPQRRRRDRQHPLPRGAAVQASGLGLMALLLLPSPVAAEGSAELGGNQPVEYTTVMFVDILDYSVETVTWTGRGTAVVTSPSGTLLGASFLDITALTSGGSEQGLLGLAFHPDYASNGLFYQWYLDGEPIPGAEGNSWNATESGFYQVAVTDANGCTALSEMIEVVINGVEEFAAPVWQVFPNPAKSGEAIRLSGPAATVAVFSADGRLLQEENGWEQGEWKISPLPAGWYTLRLQNEQAVEVVRIVVQ